MPGLRVLLDDLAGRPGYWNMAVDEALLHYWRPGDDPVLRLYTWRPTGVSLGRSQSLSSIRPGEARRRGWGVVRRPTGGAALVHPEDGELTYSFVGAAGLNGLPEGLEDSARLIAEAVRRGLVAAAGLDARLSDEPYSVEGPPLCYARGGVASIVVDGRKISGSAQVRVGKKILQHGTLLLRCDYGSWAAVLGMEPEAIRASTTCLGELGAGMEVEALAEKVVEGFAEVLGLDPYYDRLRLEEERLAQSLLYKYRSDEWLKLVP